MTVGGFNNSYHTGKDFTKAISVKYNKNKNN